MTYTQAKMIVWNHDSYGKDEIISAAVHILGTINASVEDIDQAMMVVISAEKQGAA